MENNILIDGQMYDGETGELINEVEQIEVEVIGNVLPAIICNGGTHIKTNTEQLKKELTTYLAKYDIEVTEDTEKDCSKMATELNKLSKDLDDKRKATAIIITKPADELKIAVDELIAIVQDKRKAILAGVDVFKQKRFDFIRTLLKAKIEELYTQYKVSEKYQVCNIETLVVEGSLAKVQLSKSALESLEFMVIKVKKLEDEVTIREMRLELKCSNAGLMTPIELNEVQDIIEDADYDEKLDLMIKKRLEIEERTKALIKMQEEQKEALLKEEELKKQQEKENEDLREQRKAIEKQKETGKKVVKLIATFEVEVNADVTDDKVWAKYAVELKKQFSTFVNLKILYMD
jgi:hypothetical protein